MNLTIALLGICILAETLAFLLITRFNLHMFQLNGYKIKEHCHWIKNNAKSQLILLSTTIGIIAIPFFKSFSYLILSIISIILVFYYYSLKKKKNKKVLVYTNRVKRLIITNLLIFTITSAAFGFIDIKFLAVAIACFILLEPVFIVASNIINLPIEKAINNYYINDAKKMLKNSKDLIVIGITGSYGKTSVKFYLQTLLQTKYNVLVTPESYNTPMGVVKTIRKSLKPTHEIFICEMGARNVGDIQEICDIVNPNHGVITSIGPQHLETFLNIENIIKTKFELADSLPSNGLLFLNGSNSYINSAKTSYKNVVLYGGDNNGYAAKDFQLSQNGTKFTVASPNEEEQFQMRLIGEHNIINVLGAISVANSFGIPLKDLKVPVRRLQPVEHRMQIIKRGDITIIDDAYNSNPVGSKAAVTTLAMFDGIKILITPGMVELGESEYTYNYEFGVFAASICDYVLLIGENQTIPIAKGLKDSGFDKSKYRAFEKLEDALTFAYSIKDKGHKYILLENDLPDNY